MPGDLNTTDSSAVTLDYTATLIKAVVVVLLAVVTFVGNSLVILAFYLYQRLHILSNYFLVSLAVADTLIGLVTIPLYSVFILNGYWPLGAVVCDIWLCLDYTLTNASAAHLLVMCLDRYLAVSAPMAYRTRRSPKKIFIMIAIAWVVPVLLWSPWIISWPYIEGQRTVPATDCYVQFQFTYPILTICTSLIAFYIPMTLMIVSHMCIYRINAKQNARLASLQSNEGRCCDARIETNASITASRQVSIRSYIFKKCFIRACPLRFGEVDCEIPTSGDTQGRFAAIATVHQEIISSQVNGTSAATISKVVSNSQSNRTNMDECAIVLNKDRQHSRREQSQNRKLAKVLSAILITYLITWTPYQLLVLLQPFCPTCVNANGWYIGKLCYRQNNVFYWHM
ncbi:hypothetical protein DPMN_006529 [Dreissena polymorpha]|uniref:G-protein coupled receptors family 1 profile domain-containing protein n=1 Tax=Dreissena polymorpha TaxID=45954 RepID=A0A9D4RXU3_DREPO|nr:hypothetical protein DPMN_006529 [Dreissena polymorpha]